MTGNPLMQATDGEVVVTVHRACIPKWRAKRDAA
jgi:hypothetical protein